VIVYGAALVHVFVSNENVFKKIERNKNKILSNGSITLNLTILQYCSTQAEPLRKRIFISVYSFNKSPLYLHKLYLIFSISYSKDLNLNPVFTILPPDLQIDKNQVSRITQYKKNTNI